jgi:hypothetical protein
MKGIPPMGSRSEATRQTCVFNGTQRSEGNRRIHATSSTRCHQQKQCAEEVLDAAHAIIRRLSLGGSHLKQASLTSECSVAHTALGTVVSFSCTTSTSAIGSGQSSSPPVLTMASTQNCWWTWLPVLCVVDLRGNIHKEWRKQYPLEISGSYSDE